MGRLGKVGKQKTHSGAKKRTDITGSGKIRMGKAAHRHRLNQKSSRQKNLGGGKTVLTPSDSKRLKPLLQM